VSGTRDRRDLAQLPRRASAADHRSARYLGSTVPMEERREGDEMPLGDAVQQYAALTDFASTYATYRGHAARWGSVALGVEVPTYKDARGRWVVRRSELERGLDAERQERARRTRAGADYRERVLHGPDGQRIWTDSGSYERRGAFHVWYDPHMHRHEGRGASWICNACWQPAVEEHNHDYCLSCDDLSDCGRDCTLSAVRCEACGVRMTIEADPNLYRAVGSVPGV